MKAGEKRLRQRSKNTYRDDDQEKFNQKPPSAARMAA